MIQITDTHILDNNTISSSGYDTTASLNNIVRRIQKSEKETDLILLTGDLAHEPTKTAYQKLADSLRPLTMPLYYLPGNHDSPEMMEYIMSSNGFDSARALNIGNWLILLLNTKMGYEQAGQLGEAEYKFLRHHLAVHTAPHCLIALHHHPVAIGSLWMDAISLVDGERLFEVIEPFSQVKVIIWGHIHQEFEMRRGHLQLYGTPSTCLQFVPRSEVCVVDDKTPAYRKIALEDNGKVSSKVVYLQ